MHCNSKFGLRGTEFLHVSQGTLVFHPQLHRGGVFGGAGCGLQHLGLLAEPCGSEHHDDLLPGHHLLQAAFYQEVFMKFSIKT